MDIIAEEKLKTASQIYYCLVKAASNNKCTIVFNNNQYVVPYYGGAPTPNKTYALFLPQNNMNLAFVVGEGGSGGGGGGSGIAIQPDPPLGDELVWIDTDDPGTQHIIPEVKDNEVSQYDTWSSSKIRDFIYPVGSIYLSVSSVSPATIFGGTWVQLKDQFLLGAGDTYTVGDTGGEAEHTLTTDEMPSHDHTSVVGTSGQNFWTGSGGTYITVASGSAYGFNYGWSKTSSAGNGQAHNNMPPYLVVYMWERTA